MPKIETIYARLSLKSYDDTFTLNERPSEINERLYDVLSDDFYLKKLTDTVAKAHPSELAAWTKYREERTSPRPSDLNAVAKFTVWDQKVDLIDIAFY
jgi:hypothetical protein